MNIDIVADAVVVAAAAHMEVVVAAVVAEADEPIFRSCIHSWCIQKAKDLWLNNIV